MIEGSFDISEVDVHLCRGCAIAAPAVPGGVSRERTRPGNGDPMSASGPPSVRW